MLNGDTESSTSGTGSSSRRAERVLVVGAAGQLGAALVAQSWPVGTFVLPATRDQLDITDREAVRSYVEHWQPTVVVNAAAYTAVDAAEEHPKLAAAINHQAVDNLAAATEAVDGKLIHISTDYVFDGASPGWYTEHDQVNPLSVYGRSKRAGELAALCLDDALVIRTSWLYSSLGSNFVKTIRKLGRTRSSLEVLDDQHGCPTSADELAQAIVAAIGAGLGYSGLFHVASPDDATWWDLADEVLRLDGTREGVHLSRIGTDGYPVAATRPADSRICSDAFAAAYGIVLSPWREALAAVSTKLDRQDLNHPDLVSEPMGTTVGT